MIAELQAPPILAEGDSYLVISRGSLTMHLETILAGISGIGTINALLSSADESGRPIIDSPSARESLHGSIALLADAVAESHDALFCKICQVEEEL